MKKIFTMIAAVVIVASVSAQRNNGNENGYDRNRDVVINERPYNHNDDRRDNRYNLRERDMQVARINNEYDRKIESVRHKFFMSRSKKEAWICSLEDQRRDEIKRVNLRYRVADRHNDRDNGWHK